MATRLCVDSYFWSRLKSAICHVDVKMQKVAATTHCRRKGDNF